MKSKRTMPDLKTIRREVAEAKKSMKLDEKTAKAFVSVLNEAAKLNRKCGC